MNLFDNAAQVELQNAIRDIHDTFSHPVTGYKLTSIDTVTQGTDYNHNYTSYLYANTQPNTTVTTNTVSGVFDIRVGYVPMTQRGRNIQQFVADDIRLKKGATLIKLKMTQAAWAFIKDAQFVHLDDMKTVVVTSHVNHGLFFMEYVDVILGEVS